MPSAHSMPNGRQKPFNREMAIRWKNARKPPVLSYGSEGLLEAKALELVGRKIGKVVGEKGEFSDAAGNES